MVVCARCAGLSISEISDLLVFLIEQILEFNLKFFELKKTKTFLYFMV